MNIQRRILEWVRKENNTYIILTIVIFAVVLLLYKGYAILLGRSSAGFSYWDLLARSFLQRKLYLVNPTITYDLTLFNGNWYVPQPPLPAVLMLPVELFAGHTNPISFSIFFSAVNCALLFIVLVQLSKLGWINTSKSAIFCLVLLFAFGSPHWYVGMDGDVWFLSQVVTITFIVLAILCALTSRSAWIVGLCLGAAIFARPNVITIWPLLVAIKAQKQKDEIEKIQFTHLAVWSVKTIIPILMFVFGLLTYNFLRFQNPFDFGYTTINGLDRIVLDVQTYGMFNVHFIPRNLELMFFKLPDLQLNKPFVVPSVEGMSMFLTTPALFYLFHKYEKRIWIIGSWLTVLLSVGMLSLYHNTGAYQFGYRYILDFIVPLIILLATTFKNGIPRPLILLIMISIVINEYGAFWFLVINH